MHTHALTMLVFVWVSFLNSVLVWKLCEDFDIFWFRSAIANPWVISVLNGGCLRSSAALIKLLWNQPLCWSAPSRTKSQLGVFFLSFHTRLASNQTSTTSVICFQFCFRYLLYRVLSSCHRWLLLRLVNCFIRRISLQSRIALFCEFTTRQSGIPQSLCLDIIQSGLVCISLISCCLKLLGSNSTLRVSSTTFALVAWLSLMCIWGLTQRTAGAFDRVDVSEV